GGAGRVAKQADGVAVDGTAGVQSAAVWRRADEADVVMARAAGAAARLVLPVVRQRRRAAMALHAVAHVLRVGDLVRLLEAPVRASGQLEILAHVQLVDEDREVQDRFVVDHGQVALPSLIGGYRGEVGRGLGRGESHLVVVAAGARADVEAHAAMELAGPQFAGAVGGGTELRMALEAGPGARNSVTDVDLFVLPGDVLAGRGDEILDHVDRRERVAGRGEQDDDTVYLRRLVRRPRCSRAGSDDLGEAVLVGAVRQV